MKMTTKKHAFYGILAMVSLLGLGITQSAQATAPGLGDPFTLRFDENGNGQIDLRDGNGFHMTMGFAQADPTQGGHAALTYLLDGNVGPGVVDVLDANGHLSDAISFYNIGAQGFMAYYSGDNGGTLADILSAGFVPVSGQSVNEVGNMFAYFSGGVQGANNDYFGISSAPDGGSTLALLGVAMLGVGLLHRRIKAATNRA